MTVIIMNRERHDVTQLDNVTNVAFDSGTGIYTITYNGGQTLTASKNDWLITILFA